MINLFEYQNKVTFEGDFQSLEVFLDEVWKKRQRSESSPDNISDKIEVQQFIQFLHKQRELKSNKYVGVIHFDGKIINLLPKIFFNGNRDYSANEINSMQLHIMWWLSYCRKIKFPNYQSALAPQQGNLFEILIYLFAKYTRELLSNSIYQQYEEINKELVFIKGRVNINSYINENLGKGRWHLVNCNYDAFELDNKFNRIIKYVSKLLFNTSQNSDNKKHLREILFILDEVTDVTATAEACKSIQFNPMFSQFEIVRDYCLLFLENCISMAYKNNLKLFAFLLPMEYVFEDFIFGFIDKEIKEIKVKAQSSQKDLDEGGNFCLKPDLLFRNKNKEFIADTKYKIIYADDIDPKNGISQTDLYQVLSYAVRFNIPNVKLFYPGTTKSREVKQTEINIIDELAGKKVNITIHQLPIINFDLSTIINTSGQTLESLFLTVKVPLKEKLIQILT